jgi:Arc/MetJ-type ribon-helix-helix transcriptional regulator
VFSTTSDDQGRLYLARTATYITGMSTTIHLTPHSEELLKAQLARGPYRSPEEVIESALESLAQAQTSPAPAVASKKTPAEAVADIMELRKGVRLGGLKIKDLVHEGHKH